MVGLNASHCTLHYNVGTILMIYLGRQCNHPCGYFLVVMHYVIFSLGLFVSPRWPNPRGVAPHGGCITILVLFVGLDSVI